MLIGGCFFCHQHRIRLLHRQPYDTIARRQRSDFMAGVPRLTARGLGAGSRPPEVVYRSWQFLGFGSNLSWEDTKSSWMMYAARNNATNPSATHWGASSLDKDEVRAGYHGDAGDALQNLSGGAGANVQLCCIQYWCPYRQSLPCTAPPRCTVARGQR